MYLHLGGGAVVRESDVVAVFDLDNSSTSYRTREFLKKAQEEGRVRVLNEELPKSFAVCADGLVYLSQLNSATLLKRTAYLSFQKER